MHSWKKTQNPSSSQKASCRQVPPWKQSKFLHFTTQIIFFIVKFVLQRPQPSSKLSVHVLLHCMECSSRVFYFCRVTHTAVWQEKFRNSRLFMEAGGVSLFPCPDIHPTIRFKPLDLLRPTSNRTPLTCSKYQFKSRSFLKCLLPPQQPRMVQPPPKSLPIYYYKRLPWNMLGGSPFVRGAKCFC